jgi:hypothetical protein
MMQAIGTVAGIQLIGLVLAYVYSNYFGRATFADAYLFRSVDSSPLALGATSSPILGSHHFGDFQWPLSTTKDLGRGGYYGGAQLFFFMVRDLPSTFGLLLAIIIPVVLILMAVNCLSRELTTGEVIAGAILLFFATQPVLLAVDRGQIHLLMVALLVLGFSLQVPETSKTKRQLGAMLIALAASMKIVPVFFLLFFLRKNHRSQLLSGIGVFVAALLLPTAFIRSGIGSLLSIVGIQQFEKSDITDSLYLSSSYFEETKAFNHSFKALIGVLQDHTVFFEDFLSLGFDHYLIVVAAIIVVSTCLVVSKKLTDAESLLVCVILASRLVPISSGYTLMAFLIPIFVVLADNAQERQRSNRICALICALSIMPTQIRIGGLPFAPNSYTYSSLFGPAISLCFLFAMLLRALLPSSFRSGKVFLSIPRFLPRDCVSIIRRRYLN